MNKIAGENGYWVYLKAAKELEALLLMRHLTITNIVLMGLNLGKEDGGRRLRIYRSVVDGNITTNNNIKEIEEKKRNYLDR